MPSRLTSGGQAPGRYHWASLGWLLALAIPKCPLCLLALLGIAGGLEAGAPGAWLTRWPLLHALVLLALSVLVLLTWRAYGWRRGAPAGLIALGAWGTKFFMSSALIPAVLGACLLLLWLAPRRFKPSCCDSHEHAPSHAPSQRKGVPG